MFLRKETGSKSFLETPNSGVSICGCWK